MEDPLGTIGDALRAIAQFVVDLVNELAEVTGLSLPVLSFLAIFLAFAFLGMTAKVRG